MGDRKEGQPVRVAPSSSPSWQQITKALIAGGVAGGVCAIIRSSASLRVSAVLRDCLVGRRILCQRCASAP